MGLAQIVKKMFVNSAEKFETREGGPRSYRDKVRRFFAEQTPIDVALMCNDCRNPGKQVAESAPAVERGTGPDRFASGGRTNGSDAM